MLNRKRADAPACAPSIRCGAPTRGRNLMMSIKVAGTFPTPHFDGNIVPEEIGQKNPICQLKLASRLSAQTASSAGGEFRIPDRRGAAANIWQGSHFGRGRDPIPNVRGGLS